MDKFTKIQLVRNLVHAQEDIEAAKDRLTHCKVLLDELRLTEGEKRVLARVQSMRNVLYADRILTTEGSDGAFFNAAELGFVLTMQEIPEQSTKGTK